jgi:hypothetical protein
MDVRRSDPMSASIPAQLWRPRLSAQIPCLHEVVSANRMTEPDKARSAPKHSQMMLNGLTFDAHAATGLHQALGEQGHRVGTGSKCDSIGPGDNIENLWERSRSIGSKATRYPGNSERRRTFHPGTRSHPLTSILGNKLHDIRHARKLLHHHPGSTAP